MVTEGKYTDIIGKKVHVIVDRPAGSYHPRNHDIFYSINYGYIEDIIAGDVSGHGNAVELYKGCFSCENKYEDGGSIIQNKRNV